MNILQILPELNIGGVETGTLDLAKYLVRLGHKAVVISNGGVLVKELKLCGAIHYELPVDKKSFPVMVKMVWRLIEIIKKEKIDIVHARSRVPAWIAYFATRFTPAVFVTTCHGYYKKHPFSRVMGWAKRVIVVSNVIGRHMIDDFGVPHEQIRLIPRGVDLERFQAIGKDEKRKDQFNIGIIGRITPIKGHSYFIKAMARVIKSVPNIKIWIVGDAPSSREAYKEEVQILVKRLGLWQHTEFLGSQKDIPAILSNLDLLVLATTTHEAFGRVIIEAQAARVPVIATRVGGVIDVVEDGRTGLLVPPAEPVSMAKAIIRILEDKNLAQHLVENAYKNVKDKYDAELMARRTVYIYKEALGESKILIIKFSSLGDIILSSAGLRAIRNKFLHTHKISFLVGAESRDVLLGCPYIDELLVCDFKHKDKGIGGFLKLAHLLRKKNFDLVIDLQNNRKSHLLAFLSLARQRYGYDNKKLGFLLNHRIKDDGLLMQPVPHQFRALGMLGITPDDLKLEIWPREEDRNYIDELLGTEWLSANQKMIGINISASPRWATKFWPLAHVAKLCQELSHRDIRLVITGTERDLDCANALLNKFKDIKPINACGKTTVNQLACLIKKCSVYVSADSSPLHIAAAVGTPFVALFGPTDWQRHLPPAKDYVVIAKGLPCSPCYKTKCKTKKCMQLITPEEVIGAVEKLLLK